MAALTVCDLAKSSVGAKLIRAAVWRLRWKELVRVMFSADPLEIIAVRETRLFAEAFELLGPSDLAVLYPPKSKFGVEVRKVP